MRLSASPLAVIALGALLQICRPAWAAPTPAEEKQAKALYDKGTLHFNLGEYAAAIEHYKEAYRIVANPYFLYNIAQAARLSGDLRQALTFYRSFLNALPDASNRAEIQTRITELEEAIRKDDESRRASPTAVKPLEQPPEKPIVQTPPPVVPFERTKPGIDEDMPSGHTPFYKKWWFWAGAGVLAVGVTGTAIAVTRDDAPSTDLGNFVVF